MSSFIDLMKCFEEWRSDAKKKYSDLEDEFREALKLEDHEKKKLWLKIEELKNENSDLKINQEKIYFSERQARETLKMVTEQAKSFRQKNDESEDKISRLVDALRKSKELAESRYRDEQRTKGSDIRISISLKMKFKKFGTRHGRQISNHC